MGRLIRKISLLPGAALAFCAAAVPVQSEIAGDTSSGRPIDYTGLSDAALVDSLVSLDNESPGLTKVIIDYSFEVTQRALLSNCPPKPATSEQIRIRGPGTFERKPLPPTSPIVFEIVHRGAAILPELMAAMNDKRATHLLVISVVGSPNDKGGGMVPALSFGGFQRTYNSRRGKPGGGTIIIDHEQLQLRPKVERYYARVGDMAYFLVGEIVNRSHVIGGLATTSSAVLWSPIETPSLARRTRKDWQDVDSMDKLRGALMEDIHAFKHGDHWHVDYRGEGALLRLRHYFPDDYSALTGADAAARDAYQKRLCDDRPPDYPDPL